VTNNKHISTLKEQSHIRQPVVYSIAIQAEHSDAIA